MERRRRLEFTCAGCAPTARVSPCEASSSSSDASRNTRFSPPGGVDSSFMEAQLRERYDAIVVGARCAGAATAMLLARRGLEVLLFDRDRRGADTLSTLAMMRAGVLQLRRWGLLDQVRAGGTPAIRSTSFVYGDEVITVPIKPRDGVDALVAPRRTLLDVVLADAASAAGADVRYGPRFVDLVRDPNGRVSGVVLEDRDRSPHRV